MKKTKIFAIILLAFLVLFALFWFLKDTISPSAWIESIGAAILGAIIATIVSPHNQRWLWNMSSWVMQKIAKRERPREGASISFSQYPVSTDIMSSVSSLSHLRKIRHPELWVVTSGKGGVGKSLLSLGLAECVSQREPVLLVDFDLHNRGLTSLLRIESDNIVSNAFDLLGEFRNMLRGDDQKSPFGYLVTTIESLPGEFEARDFNVICQKFARQIRLDNEVWGDVGMHDCIPPQLLSISHMSDTISVKNSNELFPENLSFLPSRTQGTNFLLSDQSGSSYIIIALFLQTLCAWIKETAPATKIIGNYVVDLSG